MITQIGLTNPQNHEVAIFDARPYLSALANRCLGGGFEDQRYYDNCYLTFLGIDNIHAVRSSHNALRDISNDSDVLNVLTEYGPKVYYTGHMQMVGIILEGVNLIMDTILVKK